LQYGLCIGKHFRIIKPNENNANFIERNKNIELDISKECSVQGLLC
jgi:hypothetical protein